MAFLAFLPALLLKLLPFINPLASITGKIADAKIELAKSQSDKDRIASEERVKTLEARRDVLVSEAGSGVNTFIRAGYALPFVIYNAKLVLWDKVLALGSTDALSPELFQVELACLGFYCLSDIASRWRR